MGGGGGEWLLTIGLSAGLDIAQIRSLPAGQDDDQALPLHIHAAYVILEVLFPGVACLCACTASTVLIGCWCLISAS